MKKTPERWNTQFFLGQSIEKTECFSNLFDFHKKSTRMLKHSVFSWSQGLQPLAVESERENERKKKKKHWNPPFLGFLQENQCFWSRSSQTIEKHSILKDVDGKNTRTLKHSVFSWSEQWKSWMFQQFARFSLRKHENAETLSFFLVPGFPTPSRREL